MSTDSSPSGCVGADDELGRAAADVEHEVRRRVRRVRRSRPRTSSSPSSSPVMQLRPHADRGLGRVEELLAVASRRATRSSRSCARARRRARRSACRYSRSTATVRSIASGWSWRVCVHTLTEARDPRVALDGAAAARLRRRRRRRRAGGSSWSRCRSRRPASLHLSASARELRSATQRPTGSSPPAR